MDTCHSEIDLSVCILPFASSLRFFFFELNKLFFFSSTWQSQDREVCSGSDLGSAQSIRKTEL